MYGELPAKGDHCQKKKKKRQKFCTFMKMV